MRASERVVFFEEGGELCARVASTPDLEPVDAQTLRRALDASDYAAWALMPDALDMLARRLGADAGEFELAIGHREDAGLAVEVAPDASCAWLAVTAARGGAPARPEGALLALAAAGVRCGIDTEAVRQACASGVGGRVAVAHATAPQPGEDARFELLVVDTRDRSPKVDEDGLVDFHELGDIPIVDAGQALMRRHPPTPGIDGRNVRGDVLPAHAGHDEAFDTRLPGSGVDPDDANLLRASCRGQPVHTRNGVAVEQVLKLKNVNLASGNIHFDGTVEVAGDVSPGMTVQASGDIIVHGLVEGARLDAEGSVKISGGAIARSEVKAGIAASARFVENASIQAGTVIVIEQTALHSDLQALNHVLVGTNSGTRGRLIGGSTRAMMLVRTPQLGAPAGGLTKVQVGVNPALSARRQELDRRTAAQKEEEDKLHKVLRHLQRHGDPRGMLARVQAAWKQSVDEWGQLLAESELLDRELALAASARIEVGVAVSGDVDIAFGHLVRHLRRSCSAGAFHAEADQVLYTDAAGHAVSVV